MGRGVRIVNQNQIVEDIDNLFIAYGGQAKEVGSGFAAQAGVVRQFWPKTAINVSGIVMDTATEETYDVDTTQAAAICAYDAQSGKVILSSKNIVAINPAPRATGFYLWRITEVSGTLTSDDPIGTWVDVNSEGTNGIKEYYLINTNPGAITAQATIEVAEDDGTGNPEAATIVAKTINFKAEVITESICFTTEEWTLSNTETNENAEVYLVSVPEGWWDPINEYNVTEAYLTGEYGFPKGIQEFEVYSCDWSTSVQVKIDQVSGDAIQGDALGSFIDTNVKRTWWIDADTAGTSKQAVADITYTDGVETVTKRVNMYAEWVSEQVDPGSGISNSFTRLDAIHDEDTVSAPSGERPTLTAQINIFMNPDGTVNITTRNGGQESNFPQDWHLQAPAATDPQNYECRLFVEGGSRNDIFPSSESSVGWFGWLNLSQQVTYVAKFERTVARYEDNFLLKEGRWTLIIREVGRPETVKYKPLDLSLYLERIVT